MKTHYKKGFGILEVLISAAIIIMMLGALVSVGNVSMASSQNLLARSQATYLAQQGIETVRQIRDTNWVDGNENSTGGETTWNSLELQGHNLVAVSVDCSTPYYIGYDNNINRLGLTRTAPLPSSLNNTTFTRDIKLCPVTSGTLLPPKPEPADNAMIVQVTVSWNDRGTARSITSKELLTNWRPNF